jgi:adenylylsulfate kinase-like enzyme
VNKLMLVWLVGLSGSGKSYIGRMLFDRIKIEYRNTCFLDGDEFRDIMGNDLGYSMQDRQINGLRIVNVSNWLHQQNINVVAAVMSNFPEHQKSNRDVNGNKYYQIYIKADIGQLKEKSVKRVYHHFNNVVGQDICFNEPVCSDQVFLNDYCAEMAKCFVEEVYSKIKPGLV